jgi:hypothetical protein
MMRWVFRSYAGGWFIATILLVSLANARPLEAILFGAFWPAFLAMMLGSFVVGLFH